MSFELSTDSNMVHLRSIPQFEKEASKILPHMVWKFYITGAEGEKSFERNLMIWKTILIIPRALRDVTAFHQRTVLLGKFHLDSPIGVSPTAFNGFAHPEGEKAVARACASLNSLYIPSGISTCSMEDIAHAAPNSHRWQNIYLFKPREVTEMMVRRAERAGFGAIVVSVDIPILGLRYQGFNLEGFGKHAYPHAVSDRLAWPGNFPKGDETHVTGDPAATWEDLAWLVGFTHLPVVAKGIMNAGDADKAVTAGVKAVIVSNHGARQMDSTPAPVEVLPSIVEAVGNRIEVYTDCGVRYGSDVFKAMALGAKAVFVGRPAVYGLAVNGEVGVKKVLTILQNEFATAARLAGCNSVTEITKDSLIHESKLLAARL